MKPACRKDFAPADADSHTLWKVEGQAWRFTALAITAALAAHVKSIDERQTFAAQLGQMTGNNPVCRNCVFPAVCGKNA
jgi:hypothetical protein